MRPTDAPTEARPQETVLTHSAVLVCPICYIIAINT